MTVPIVELSRRKVWIAFAEHFLDTETRQDLPLAALVAVEAGFTVDQAREIWLHEVTPVVGPNLLCVAGEWAMWDEDWLVESITAWRGQRQGVPAGLASRLIGLLGHSCWSAIERCMEALLAAAPRERSALAADLHALARHYFDFLPGDLGLSAPGRGEALRRLYVEVFLPAFGPTVVRGGGESRDALGRRVEAALAAGERRLMGTTS